jgi:CHAD domain-containing protein
MIESQPKINVNRILNEYSDYFNSFEKNIESLKSNKKNFSLIKDGLSTIYDQGRGCYKMIITQDDAEIFHELRKNAKDLSNVLDIIQKAWPDVIKVYNNQLKVLTDHIGDIHDLYEFKLEINKFIKGNIPSEGTISLLKKLDSRINSLMLLSRKLGEKIYAEKTTSFIYRMNRISQYSI